MSTGHSARVNACAVSPYGGFFVSAGEDGTLKLWDPSSGEEIRTLAGHPGEVLHCAVGRNNLVYSAGPASSFDGVVHVWDPETGEEVASWELTEAMEVKGLAPSPTATYVATLRSYGYIDLRGPLGEPLRRLDAGSGLAGEGCAVSPDGAFIIAAGGNELHAIDPFEGCVISVFEAPGGAPFAITPDAATVVLGGAVLGDVASGNTRTIAEEGGFSSCAVSPDGSLLVGCRSEVSQTWNSISGAQRTVESASIRVLRIDPGDLLHEFDLAREEALLCAFSPDASLVFGTTAKMLWIWDAAGGEELGSIPLDAEPTCMVPHPSRSLVALGDVVGGFHVLDLGIELGPVIVTAERRGMLSEVRCPACGQASEAEDPQLGRDMDCPACGAGLRVNPFELSLRGESPPVELPQDDAEERKRFEQAQNRAIFTSGSLEDLTELARKRGLEVPAEQAPPPAPEPRITPLNEQIKAILLEEQAEAGIDSDALPGAARGMVLAGAMNTAVAALKQRTEGMLDAAQKQQLAAAGAEGNPLEVVRCLHETLPGFDVLAALREELKVAFPQQTDSTKVELMAMVNEEAQAAGIDDLPDELKGMVIPAALSRAWTAMREQADARLGPGQAAELQRRQEAGEEIESMVRFIQAALPDFDVLAELRSEVRVAFPSVVEEVNSMNARMEQVLTQMFAGGGAAADPTPPRKKRSWFRRRG